MMSEYFDGPEKDKSMRSVPIDEALRNIDPLDFMQSFINSESMPKRDRLLASAQLAPYKHARRTGQTITKSPVLPEPTSAEMAREQIGMITRIAREGNCTMEEATELIGHLEHMYASLRPSILLPDLLASRPPLLLAPSRATHRLVLLSRAVCRCCRVVRA
jgi:hypothetical protein